MLRLVLYFMIPILLVLSACDANEETIVSNEIIQLKKGVKYKIDGYSIELKDIADSRCPLNVNCIWEGVAVLKFEYTHNGDKTIFFLNTQELRSHTISRFSIKLMDVIPYPESDIKIDEDDYRVLIKAEEYNL